MFDRTTSRNFLAPRRQGRKEKISSCFSELGVLCVFAGVISFPILSGNIQPIISNRFGYIFDTDKIAVLFA
jgi:hypothetical protein